MGLEEGPPARSSKRRRIDSVLNQDLLDRVSTNLESQVVECSLDPGVAPPRIVASQLDDQVFDFRGLPRAPRSVLLAAVVLLRDELPVPSKQRIRCDESFDLEKLAAPQLLRAFG